MTYQNFHQTSKTRKTSEISKKMVIVLKLKTDHCLLLWMFTSPKYSSNTCKNKTMHKSSDLLPSFQLVWSWPIQIDLIPSCTTNASSWNLVGRNPPLLHEWCPNWFWLTPSQVLNWEGCFLDDHLVIDMILGSYFGNKQKPCYRCCTVHTPDSNTMIPSFTLLEIMVTQVNENLIITAVWRH